MWVSCIAILALSASPGEASTAEAAKPVAAAADKAQPTPRTGRELAAAANSALRHWARTPDKDTDPAARELLALYNEVQHDTSLARAQRDDLQRKLRYRLSQLAKQISHRTARQARQPAVAADSVGVEKNAKVLGQMGGGAAMGGQPGGGAGGANATGQQPDAGEDLVELIQTTIAPKTWEANGGPGTIYYWRQQRAIVVRNTAEVHEQLSDTLEQLERANH
jgi:hypothetical protein